MATDGHSSSLRRGSRWTLFLWGGAALLLVVPFMAMRLQAPGVDWTAADFVVMGALLAAVCGAVELAMRFTASWPYRLGVATAAGGAFLISWVNLAVGIVGSERNPANLLFFAALAIGALAAILARFRPAGMAAAMLVTATAVAVAFILAAAGTRAEPNVSHLRELVGTAVITSPLLLSAWFFRKASQR